MEPEDIDEYFRALEHPSLQLTPADLEFLVRARDRFDIEGDLPEWSVSILVSIYRGKA